MPNDEFIGYLKYTGKLVDQGFLDARKSAQALLGFDEAVRFFVGVQAPDLRTHDFEFPVMIRKGSWEIGIPSTIGDWIQTGAGVAITAYLATAGKKMAEKDFKDVGLKDVFRNALYAMQWIAKIGKHVGDLTQRKFHNLKFQNDNEEIGIPNSDGQYLFIPKKYFDMYQASSSRILSGVAEIIEEERVLHIGVYSDGQEQEETITRRYKRIFSYEESESEDLLFPELTHGGSVDIVGEITRGNEITNSMGISYKGYILSLIPREGSIVSYKNVLYLDCRVSGVINRLDDKGRITLRKPRIYFDRIEPLEKDNSTMKLFD